MSAFGVILKYNIRRNDKYFSPGYAVLPDVDVSGKLLRLEASVKGNVKQIKKQILRQTSSCANCLSVADFDWMVRRMFVVAKSAVKCKGNFDIPLLKAVNYFAASYKHYV